MNATLGVQGGSYDADKLVRQQGEGQCRGEKHTTDVLDKEDGGTEETRQHQCGPEQAECRCGKQAQDKVQPDPARMSTP